MVAVPHLALSSTLQHVAETKLAKLAQRRAELDEFWSKHLDDETVQFKDANSVRRLLKAMENCDHKFCDERWPKNLNTFLDQAKRDPFIRPSQITAWGKSLLSELEQKRARYDATALFSKLVLQWIQSSGSGSSSMHDSESLRGLLELEQQSKTWKSYVFEEKLTDKAEIMQYLNDLFLRNRKNGLPINRSPLGLLRQSIRNFNEISINKDTIRLAVQALLREDVFIGEKRDALEDLQTRDIVMEEIADVLRSDLNALQLWRRQSQSIPVHFRKTINGRFRVYMDEEIYQAIFIQIVGTSWAVFLKRCLKKFCASPAWLKRCTATKPNKEYAEKLINFVGSKRYLSESPTIHDVRWKQYENDFFLSRLPSSIEEGTRGDYDDDDSNEHSNNNMSFGNVNQQLLHIITTEILLRKHFYGSASYFQTDFRWFGPSIPHTTLLTLFEFFHVPSKWINFFQAFLQPTVHVEEKGGYSMSKKRLRGIPIGHTLSTAFGELMLFVLDFAVNQDTQGCNIYRIFDDIHFFGQPDSCATAWQTIQKFTRVMGLELNEDKSDFFHYSFSRDDDFKLDAMPEGQVRWGLLKLEGEGEWTLDQEDLLYHIREMTRQLRYCDSIMSFIHAYNTYMRFFVNNAGHPSFCLGKKHASSLIDMCLQVQKAVAESLSNSKHSDVVSLLCERIKNDKNMNVVSSALSDAFFFFPTHLGGLGLYNPTEFLIEAIRSFRKDPETIILDATERIKEKYNYALEAFEAGRVPDLPSGAPKSPPTLKEYTQFPEDHNAWMVAYEQMRCGGFNKSTMNITRDLSYALLRLKREEGTDTTFDQHWLVQMYGAEVRSRMGQITFGESELMPIGLVNVLRKERARWQV